MYTISKSLLNKKIRIFIFQKTIRQFDDALIIDVVKKSPLILFTNPHLFNNKSIF